MTDHPLRDSALKQWWFTWGFGQGHDNGYTIIEAESHEAARVEMTRRWGPRWGFQYASAEDAGVEQYGLHEVKS